MLCAPWLDLDGADPPDAVYLCGASVDDFAQGLLVQKVLEASHLLYKASGRQYPGVCTDTVRPCLGCGGMVQYLAYSRGGVRPLPEGGCGCGGTGLGCTGTGVRLPHQPVRAVTEVLVDGAVLPADQYRLVDLGTVLRVGAAWPCRQDMSRPDTTDGTWSITYTYGTRPDPDGLAAVGVLAVEMARACTPDAACRLPKRLQTITREGMTMTIVDPFDFLAERRFGIPEVDTWLAQANPISADRPAKVINVDRLGMHRG